MRKPLGRLPWSLLQLRQRYRKCLNSLKAWSGRPSVRSWLRLTSRVESCFNSPILSGSSCKLLPYVILSVDAQCMMMSATRMKLKQFAVQPSFPPSSFSFFLLPLKCSPSYTPIQREKTNTLRNKGIRKMMDANSAKHLKMVLLLHTCSTRERSNDSLEIDGVRVSKSFPDTRRASIFDNAKSSYSDFQLIVCS